MKIKTVAISLPCEIERKVFIQETIEKCNLSEYIIIDGVNGNDIKITPFIPPYISKLNYKGVEKVYDSRLKLDGSCLKKGEMGCAWSHLNVYDMLLKDPEYDAYLVFEDDADLIVSPTELDEFLEELKTLTFDVCHIFTSEYFPFNLINKISNNFWIPERRFFNNAAAYIVTKKGAQKLVDFAFPAIGKPADDLLSNLFIKSDDFNLIVPYKKLFKSKGFKSSILKINNIPDNPYSISIENFGTWARLGNQMFQYAYLRAISIEKGFKINLPINLSPFGYKTSQFFECFDMPHVDTSDLQTPYVTITEISMLYDEKFESKNLPVKSGNIMFDGYFQSEKYFEQYKDIIRNDFTFKENIKKVGDSFMEQFDNTTKRVALHVRRGDNLSSGSPTVMVSESFRTNAVNYLHKNNVNNFHILIFSDDKQWCRDNLNYTSNSGVTTVVSQTIVDGLSDLEELYVMSLCDHFIIGSSSYSWWAAWLSESKDKIIITPDRWFSNKLHYEKPLCVQEKDLIPTSWIRLSSDVFI
jgi:GR25 family glycosyltransferase involved in LPS biosynthesis